MGKVIDRQTAKEISDKIAAFVDSLESEYGIKSGKRSTRYSDASVKVTIDCVLTEDNRAEGVLTPAEQAYDLNAQLEGLPARGTIFESGYGEKFRIKEWMTRGRKYKVTAVNVDNGKGYKFTVGAIKNAKIVG